MAKRIQVIRLCCFRYVIDNRAEFCAINIDIVDQFPCMFMPPETGSGCYSTSDLSGACPKDRLIAPAGADIYSHKYTAPST